MKQVHSAQFGLPLDHVRFRGGSSLHSASEHPPAVKLRGEERSKRPQAANEAGGLEQGHLLRTQVDDRCKPVWPNSGWVSLTAKWMFGL